MSTAWKTRSISACLLACVLSSLGACGFFEAGDGPCKADCAPKAKPHTHKTTKVDAGKGGAGAADASVLDSGDAAMLDGGAGSANDAGNDAAVNVGPCGRCARKTPVCDTASKMCVQCLNSADDCAGNGICNGQHACVACATAADCDDPQNAACDSDGKCVPCGHPSDCAHVPGKKICDSGECVQCTGTKYSVCGKDGASNPYVCNSVTRKCSTTVTEHSAGLCVSCISDAQCNLGQLCVDVPFGSHDVGDFCLWQKNSPNGGAPSSCATVAPFVKSVAVTSVDATSAQVCALGVTTCSGYNDFRSPTVDCEPTPDVPTDSLCGAPNANDAYCRLYDGSGPDKLYRCTLPCATNEDCKAGAMCDTGVVPPVCNFF